MFHYQVEVLTKNGWSAVNEMRRDPKGVHVFYDPTERLTLDQATNRLTELINNYRGYDFRVAQINR